MFFDTSATPRPKTDISYDQIVTYAKLICDESKASYNKGMGLSHPNNLMARTCLHDLVNIVMDMQHSVVSKDGAIYFINYLEKRLNEIRAIRAPTVTTPAEALLTNKKIILEPKLYSLHRMLSFLILISNKDIRFELKHKLPPDICFTLDWEVLSRVFINLATNAIKSMDNGTITIIISAEITSGTNANFKIMVDDTGKGIPKKLRENIFALKDITRDEPCGQGLGLHFCKMALSGGLDVDTLTSEEETLRATGDTTIISQRRSPGTTFTSSLNCEYFPASEASYAEEDAIAKTIFNITSYEPLLKSETSTLGIDSAHGWLENFNNIKALFIEDSLTTTRIIQKDAPKAWQFKPNANEFMKPSLKHDLERYQFDIIIIDNNLGTDAECTGFEFAIAARAVGFTTHIIIASADDDLPERISSIENCSYLPKPYTFAELKLAIQMAIPTFKSEASSTSGAIISCTSAAAGAGIHKSPSTNIIELGTTNSFSNHTSSTDSPKRLRSDARIYPETIVTQQPPTVPDIPLDSEKSACCSCM